MSEVSEFVGRLFDSDFMPHAHCFMWRPDVLWLHVISDGVIAAAYFSIPIALMILYRRRVDFNQGHVLTLFAAFIFLCGISHVFGIWTMWDPIYRAEGVVKAMTAVVSVATAAAVWPLIPQILSIPNPREIIDANTRLERQMAETRVAEQRFRLLFESAPAAMLQVDGEGRIELVNRAGNELFGFSGQELLGRPIQHVIPISVPDTEINRKRSLEAALTLGRGPNRQGMLGKRIDGSKIPLEVLVNSLESASGSTLLIKLRDISQSLKEEKRLLAMNADLTERVAERTAELERRAEQLATSNHDLEQFASVISHDLKSPLRGVVNLVEFLLEDQADRLDEEGREHLALIKTRVSRMYEMIEGVLDYSKQASESVESESVDAAELIRVILGALELPPGVQVETRDLPVVDYPRVQLEQIFQNLLGNAIRHVRADSGRIEISARPVSGAIEFRVVDDGEGIDPQHHDRIFRIFQTLEARQGSKPSGLGLAIVKRMVERNGGTVHVESRVGEGSAFVFTVPV